MRIENSSCSTLDHLKHGNTLGLEAVPSLIEVQDRLKKTPRHKAFGEDTIPGEVLSDNASSLAVHYSRICIKAAK